MDETVTVRAAKLCMGHYPDVSVSQHIVFFQVSVSYLQVYAHAKRVFGNWCSYVVSLPVQLSKCFPSITAHVSLYRLCAHSTRSLCFPRASRVSACNLHKVNLQRKPPPDYRLPSYCRHTRTRKTPVLSIQASGVMVRTTSSCDFHSES